MMIFNHIHKTLPSGLKPWGVLLIISLCSFVYAHAEITIGGSVYGGGKSAEVGTSRSDASLTSTEVIVYSGAISQNVFGAGDGSTAIVHGNSHVQINGGAVGNNVYGGGNAADLLGATNVEIAGGQVTNAIFGGARMANVNPGELEVPDISIHDNALEGYSAHVLVTGGTINDLYGGNDITGTVDGGGVLDIRSSIEGDIYGGGNGSYAYTDRISGLTGLYYNPGAASLTALNAHRPNAERVYINVEGTSQQRTVLYGSLYCGGNSASILHEHEDGQHNEGDDDSDLMSLNIGQYVTADAVFLGNNGANMIDENILKLYAGNADPNTGLLATGQGSADFSTLNLIDAAQFASYMDAVNLSIKPSITFNNPAYTTYIGSLYCGGNVGSMTYEGVNEIDFDGEIIIYDKLVGGCNNADVPAGTYNAAYKGGILGSSDEQVETATNGIYKTYYQGNDRLVLNFAGPHLEPKYLIRDGENKGTLAWNTKVWQSSIVNDEIQDAVLVDPSGSEDAEDLRLDGATVYGGCYSSGHVNGNVVINILDDLVIPDDIFADNKSGVDYDTQGDDVLMSSLYVYGAGYGENTEIWGNTTININGGFAFQALGGGEKGTVGRKTGQKSASGTYYYDPAYSTYINLNGPNAGWSEDDDDAHADDVLAEAEYLYGGGFEGLVAGNTYMYLGNGRIYDSFGGACNADVLGHAETYIGKALAVDNDGKVFKENGNYTIVNNVFPWIIDNVYGGNDFGGTIGTDNSAAAVAARNFVSKLDQSTLSKVYTYDANTNQNPDILKAQSYVEYYNGRVDTIYGGNYGYYDYFDPLYNKYAYTAAYSYDENEELQFSTTVVGNGTVTDDEANGYNVGTSRSGYNKPYLKHAFVNIAPPATPNEDDYIGFVFGAGMGTVGYETAGDYEKDFMQQSSYVLVNIPDNVFKFRNTMVFGSGAYSGLGMLEDANPELSSNYDDQTGQPTFDADNYSAIVDLLSGRIKEAYGGGYNEGWTRRTVVNVPSGSTLKANRLFGGGYGSSNDVPCDVYEAIVNFNSNSAITYGNPADIVDGEQKAGGIYGGNNNARRTLYSKLNINSKVRSADSPDYYTARVFGAGYGPNTWTQYTEVNLNNGANVYEAYGGGYGGMVLNKASVEKWATIYTDFPEGYSDTGLASNLISPNAQASAQPEFAGKLYNANVHINYGAYAGGYCYGGGLGTTAVISGNAFIGLYGGEVSKDIYAAGTSGPIMDMFGVGSYDSQNNPDGFTASANVFIKGGTARNIYGGGWRGAVGKHYDDGDASYIDALQKDPDDNSYGESDILGEVNVVIGTKTGTTFADGIPAIKRNVYGGGEGGAIYGPANTTIYNGMIGYHYIYDDDNHEYIYEAEIEDDGKKDENGVHIANNDLEERCGNVFGGGYVANSYVDETHVKVWNGTIRGGLYGGGEIGPVGRGTVLNGLTVAKWGSTDVEMWYGHVKRNVFGGGRGYDNWRGNGWMTDDEKARMDLSSKGYVFGKTTVKIHGGTIGSADDVEKVYGNVFGGGDEGHVYSQYYNNTVDYSEGNKIRHYYYSDQSKTTLSNDCEVIISPYCQVLSTVESVTINGNTYHAGDYVITEDLNTLANEDQKWASLDITDERAVKIMNAIFAGGNRAMDSEKMFAEERTVFGNASASVTDVFDKDFITIGEDGIGGLYGDGNLTFVDGYRELNITNYGTDYYNLSSSLELEEYLKLNDRQRAYFELLYIPKVDGHTISYAESKVPHYYDDGTDNTYYKRGQKVSLETYGHFNETEKANWVLHEDQVYSRENTSHRLSQESYNLFWEAERANWEPWGFCTLYAGRMINTIQRADFCGVFGSRVVLKGAQDRVIDVADVKEYTINRLGELSLNAVNKGHATKQHGNYFGIYNVVNYLGALTSNVDFNETRAVKEDGAYPSEGDTYYEWKKRNLTNRKRNNGTSLNEVALASGVWLEIVDEKTEERSDKLYGPITGIVELTLINVQPGEGGGYVYAANQHKVRRLSGETQVTMSPSNTGAESRKRYDYYIPTTYFGESIENYYDDDEIARLNEPFLIDMPNGKHKNEEGYIDTYGYLTTDENGKEPGETGYIDTYAKYIPLEPRMQSSGNFVNSYKRIVDDCYPQNGAYYTHDDVTEAPAHYWYIRGDFYVYDQYITAYTGSATAYPEDASIPLSITAESQGRIKLVSIEENKFAYWDNYENDVPPAYRTTITEEGKEPENAILVGDVTYRLNDPISKWSYDHLVTDAEKDLFVDNTWVCTYDAVVPDPNNEGQYIYNYKEGQVFSSEPNALYICIESFEDNDTEHEKGEVLTEQEYTTLIASLTNKDNQFKYSSVFNVSNGVTHENGFVVTVDWNNPDVWNSYFHIKNSEAQVEAILPNSAGNNGNAPTGYEYSPTYKRTGTNAVLGQAYYKVGDKVDENTLTQQKALERDVDGILTLENQAAFEKAYIFTETENLRIGNTVYVPGSTIPVSTWNGLGNYQQHFDKGVICINTYQYKEDPTDTKSSFIFAGTVLPLGAETDPEPGTYRYLCNEYNNGNPISNFKDAYECTTAGNFGGKLFKNNWNYNAIDIANLDKDERDGFTFNYDALDILLGGNYFEPTNSDEVRANGVYVNDNQDYNYAGQRIDYKAVYMGSSTLTLGTSVTVEPYDEVNSVYGTPLENQTTVNKGDRLNNIDFESLYNEKINFAPIEITTSTDPSTTFYIVNTAFQVGDKYYRPGNQMTPEVYNEVYGTNDRNKVTEKTFQEITGQSSELSQAATYYICTNAFTSRSTSVSYAVGQILNSTAYGSLVNEQQNFSISGDIPRETSTLYVARDVDINSLSKDKIITVKYYYDFVESDGTGYDKMREYHIINVHIHFESGTPSVGTLMAPSTVLPGDIVELNQPLVKEGAYKVIGTGWEVYDSKEAADEKRNGMEFESGTMPLYYYQDGYWIRYYAMTYLGKTYSNQVQLSVANYHDLKDVMVGDPRHHYYIDYIDRTVQDPKREPKIYINDYSSNSMNGLELLKQLYDLTLVTDQMVTLDEDELITDDGPFKGHGLFDPRIQGAEGLVFILRSDIDHTGKEWTSIASGANDPCFKAIIHGDGYTIKGLTGGSLFKKLCDNVVYNLGVEGSFTGSGISDAGGTAENCWVINNTDADLHTYKAVMNTGVVRNTYYNDDAAVTVNSNYGYANSNGAQKKPIKAFYDGEVAYALNSFYLNKRYYDVAGTENVGNAYWFIDNSDGQAADADPERAKQSYWVSSSHNVAQYGSKGYVESRFEDGDYRYQNDVIPLSKDKHERSKLVDAENLIYEPEYIPYWPDDYIFFGQRLNYNYISEADIDDASKTHQSYPSHYDGQNRVYRAPAYYGDGTMSVAHFNQDAVLAATENPRHKSGTTPREAYQGMTAIDFTGSNGDVTGNNVAADYSLGLNASGKYYAPWLDLVGMYEGLTGFSTYGLTRNLLVYAKATNASDASTADAATTSVISSYLIEPDYDRYSNKVDGNDEIITPYQALDYGSIHKVGTDTINMVHGHLVLRGEKVNNAYDFHAASDQFLVDLNDFNAPIAYKLTNNHIMWYQRTPEVFVENAGTGWESVSLPFTSNVVTTTDKGWITHFYEGSSKGHEYWLRTPLQIAADGKTMDFQAIRKRNASNLADVAYSNEEATVKYNNSFLWDYYYSKNSSQDKNTDSYTDYKAYYHYDLNDDDTWTSYANYPLATKAHPYLIGFPSDRYYEFDMSGEFVAMNTASPAPEQLGKQTVTFVSDKDHDVLIGASDDDYENMIAVTNSGTTYYFKPTYQARELDGQTTWLLNRNEVVITETDDVTGDEVETARYAKGTAFVNDDATDSKLTTVPFRAYMSSSNVAGHAQTRGGTRASALFIGYKGDPDQLEEHATQGGLLIYGDHMNICVESTLEYPTQITIMSVSGKTLKQFSIQPGTRVQVPVNNRGVYIVNHKKIAVTR